MFFSIIKLFRNYALSFSFTNIFRYNWWIIVSLISHWFIHFKSCRHLRRLMSMGQRHFLSFYIMKNWFFLFKVHWNFMLEFLIQSCQLLWLGHFFKTFIWFIWRINRVILWTTFTALKLFLLPQILLFLSNIRTFPSVALSWIITNRFHVSYRASWRLLFSKLLLSFNLIEFSLQSQIFLF